MNTEVPAPQLLSTQRLAIIKKRLLGRGSASGINEQLDGRALLSHLEAYRQSVAEQLRGLLMPINASIIRDGVAWPPTKEEWEAIWNNNCIHAAAKALDIEL